MIRPDVALAWVAEGQLMLEQAVMELDHVGLPSRLPGWTRGHVITHVARNAEGLMRLLHWARTGITTPMYPSMEARAADIEAGAGRPRAEQFDDLRRTGTAFITAVKQLSAKHWQTMVGTRHGPIPASAIPWLRAREVWLHLVDLDTDAEIDVLPEDMATALVSDVAADMDTRAPTRIEVRISGGISVVSALAPPPQYPCPGRRRSWPAGSPAVLGGTALPYPKDYLSYPAGCSPSTPWPR